MLGHLWTDVRTNKINPIKLNINYKKINNKHRFNQSAMDHNIKETNRYYGGKSPKVTNVLSVQGMADPWHTRGIFTNNTNGVEAVFIPG